jgi:hypothetical protein
MANRLNEQGLTLDTILVLPCDVNLVVGLRELWRDLNNGSNKEQFFSADLLEKIGEKPSESWADFCATMQDFDGIIARAFRQDRHFISSDRYSLGMVLRCQWFSANDFNEVVDQALSWGDDLLKNEYIIFNNHADLSAALVGAHNDSN